MGDATCYFCEAAPADPERAVAVEAERSDGVGTKTVSTEPSWVPRCAPCARRHGRRQSLGAVTLTLVVLSWIFGMPLVLLGEHGPLIYLGACAAVTVANILFWRSRDRRPGAKGVYAAEHHPSLDAWRAQGFTLVVRR